MKKHFLSIVMMLLVTLTTVGQQLREIKTIETSPDATDSVLLRLEEQGYRLDTTMMVTHEEIVERNVVTNPFWHNVFFTGSFGGHAFRGDFANYGKFSETLDYDWFVGAGKWFTPELGIKMEWGMGQSHGFMDSQYVNENYPYAFGDLLTNNKGDTYYRNHTKWWDVSISGVFNLSRAIFGYEGADSKKRMNQFIASLGIGYVHHRNVPWRYCVADEFSAHGELQYSRFFNKKKYVSLDLKVRGLLYQTSFDRHDHHTNSNPIDANWGVAIGATVYLKHNVWGYKTHPKYTTNYLTLTHVDTVRVEAPRAPEYGQMTFYVFFPNNYSGRNDAPQIVAAPVNAIDYLAGGLFTQKKFVDNGKVALHLAKGSSLRELEYTDVATVKAYENLNDNLPRGYEMGAQPMSLLMDKDAMTTFRETHDYYYASIWDGKHEWGYRIDDAALGQNLSSLANYKESDSFGLNSQQGLGYVREHLGTDSGSDLYSFADIYAAIEGNEGYVSRFVDNNSVAKLRKIFTEGTITNVSVTGVATSQDNSNRNTATKRNSELAQNRAKTILEWLKGCESVKISEAQAQIYLGNDLQGPIHQVDDKSTRGLNAKLHRCVKVVISYMH